jgi:DNA-binding transcriptional MocR family regulator
VGQRKEVRRRKSLVASQLANLDFRTHEDCCHFWIALPEPWRASELITQLEEHHVLVKGAEAFAIGRIGVPQCIRVSVSGVATDGALLEGFRKIADTISGGPYRVIE